MSAPEFTAGRENGRRRPRGYADWRPQAATKALLGDVEDVLDRYREHLPLTIRQVFYALVITMQPVHHAARPPHGERFNRASTW